MRQMWPLSNECSVTIMKKRKYQFGRKLGYGNSILALTVILLLIEFLQRVNFQVATFEPMTIYPGLWSPYILHIYPIINIVD